MQEVYSAIEGLVAFAATHGLIGKEDLPWARNLLLDALSIEGAPAAATAYAPVYAPPLPATATPFLQTLCAYAARQGPLKEDAQTFADLFSARLMGLLTASPSCIAHTFSRLLRAAGARAATDWFYALCRSNDSIRVDDIARNVMLKEDSSIGKLTLTINLSKPEKDPKAIALARLQPASGYPLCMLCVENTGYAGRADFPARQNHRMVPLTLDGRAWHMQYSPYLYYDEHCIVLNDQHVPMQMGRPSFEAMFDFVDQFPHYFIGSNADLPIVGGSILSHDHYQGGNYTFPMTIAPIKIPLEGLANIQAGIVDWPVSTLRLVSPDRAALGDQAVRILDAWRTWDDAPLGILAHSDEPHNAITPTLRKDANGHYVLDLALRNNRTSSAHPSGIFHPHQPLHHIKKENIGLIEVMGLFILPGRLKGELSAMRDALCAVDLPDWQGDAAMAPHLPWVRALREKHGPRAADRAQVVLSQELAQVCAQVLIDCGVFPQSAAGEAGMLRFCEAIALKRA